MPKKNSSLRVSVGFPMMMRKKYTAVKKRTRRKEKIIQDDWVSLNRIKESISRLYRIRKKKSVRGSREDNANLFQETLVKPLHDSQPMVIQRMMTAKGKRTLFKSKDFVVMLSSVEIVSWARATSSAEASSLLRICSISAISPENAWISSK